MNAELYDGDRLLASGPCTLSSGAKIVTGSMAVDPRVNLLTSHSLSVRLESGEALAITPQRLEHAAGGPAILVFEVTP